MADKRIKEILTNLTKEQRADLLEQLGVSGGDLADTVQKLVEELETIKKAMKKGTARGNRGDWLDDLAEAWGMKRGDDE